jgi:hypothetical protein
MNGPLLPGAWAPIQVPAHERFGELASSIGTFQDACIDRTRPFHWYPAKAPNDPLAVEEPDSDNRSATAAVTIASATAHTRTRGHL